MALGTPQGLCPLRRLILIPQPSGIDGALGRPQKSLTLENWALHAGLGDKTGPKGLKQRLGVSRSGWGVVRLADKDL